MSEGKERHGSGWYVGVAVFWAIAFWLVTVGLMSIIPQIFWPEVAERPSPGQSCREVVLALRAELLERGGEGIRDAALGAAASDLSGALKSWDQRYAGAGPTCHGTALSAWEELGRIRHGLSSLVQGFQRDQGPRIQRMDVALGRPAR